MEKKVLQALKVRGVKMEGMDLLDLKVIQVQMVFQGKMEKMVREVNMVKEHLHS